MSKVHPLISALLKGDDNIYVRASKILARNTAIPQRTLNEALALIVKMANSYNIGEPALIDTITLLLKKGANPNIEINWGTTTPLEFAYHNRRPDVVRILLEYGAEISTEFIDDVLYEHDKTALSTPMYESQMEIMNMYKKRIENSGLIAERQAANVLYRKFERDIGTRRIPLSVAQYAATFMETPAERQGANILQRKFARNTGTKATIGKTMRRPGTFIPEDIRKYASTFMRGQPLSSSNRRRHANLKKATQRKTKSVAGGGGN